MGKGYGKCYGSDSFNDDLAKYESQLDFYKREFDNCKLGLSSSEIGSNKVQRGIKKCQRAIDACERWLSKHEKSTAAADDIGVIPGGVYVCRITKGSLESSHSNPCYEIEFTVIKGEFKRRNVRLGCTLTRADLPQSKRDLTRFGITSIKQMEQPLPWDMRCEVTVVLETGDDAGSTHRNLS
jgi:hypothetical protein